MIFSHILPSSIANMMLLSSQQEIQLQQQPEPFPSLVESIDLIL